VITHGEARRAVDAHQDTSARLAVESCHTEKGLCGKAGASIAPPWHYGIADGSIREFANDNPRHVANATRRKGDWMQTYTGRKFWPLDARPEDVDIRDIAHALSMLCRYGGHSLRFYSVAEHSAHIARWLDGRDYKPEVCLAGLLHDATEAYLTDVPRPLKRSLPEYKEYEAELWTVIAKAFGLTGYEDDLPMVVHEADNRILADEIRQNMKPMDWHAKHDKPLGVSLQFWPPERAEKEFLETFADLCRRIDIEPGGYPCADREASAADRAYQLRMEEAA
jgi:hypothetical protein